ncbi:MAG: sigma-70 family RNA polymerase sigma factor [Proteiniphilum sp.]|jgi:RNA polymerase sigma factor (sigma-70 family)|uniref:sigma-70 family RNA polymerase sigma factor n=1 Tax=Proteiniphilum sp. TaxID=1926877 RepID=UPI00092A02E8|nr:sigma-70 family RNA polymerase sigma factor [Proteiniphilum sp.]MEA5127120.1 sigma-70 family RNA polymerase sigma factor [Proteiniphilum sp.]OJV75609.1 MAG: RNA polymerase subunit sigma-24 [Bacteroidia bacterium 44-10]
METFCTMTDEELVVSYADGNDYAFDLLLNRHKQSLYTYIYYTVRDQGLAEDIFQDTFFKAITTIRQGRYTETGKFKAWLTRIAHNLIIDYFRQKKNENIVSNDDYEFDLFNNSSLCDETVEMKMVKNQVFSDVKRLIDFLPDEQREVLQMRYYGDLSFKEIAEVTGVSINTALGRMRYAILNMRKLATDHKMILTIN